MAAYHLPSTQVHEGEIHALAMSLKPPIVPGLLIPSSYPLHLLQATSQCCWLSFSTCSEIPSCFGILSVLKGWRPYSQQSLTYKVGFDAWIEWLDLAVETEIASLAYTYWLFATWQCSWAAQLLTLDLPLSGFTLSHKEQRCRGNWKVHLRSWLWARTWR